mgnify:CR=1 FL=1
MCFTRRPRKRVSDRSLEQLESDAGADEAMSTFDGVDENQEPAAPASKAVVAPTGRSVKKPKGKNAADVTSKAVKPKAGAVKAAALVEPKAAVPKQPIRKRLDVSSNGKDEVDSNASMEDDSAAASSAGAMVSQSEGMSSIRYRAIQRFLRLILCASYSSSSAVGKRFRRFG